MKLKVNILSLLLLVVVIFPMLMSSYYFAKKIHYQYNYKERNENKAISIVQKEFFADGGVFDRIQDQIAVK